MSQPTSKPRRIIALGHNGRTRFLLHIQAAKLAYKAEQRRAIAAAQRASSDAQSALMKAFALK